MSLFRFGVFKLHAAPTGDESNTASTSEAAIEESVANNPTDKSDSETDSDIRQPKKRKKTNPVRKYDPSYLTYGFISVELEETPRPLCLVCKEILANSSMAPVKLERHLRTKHPEVRNEKVEYFERLKIETKQQSKSMDSFAHSEIAAIHSSFVVSYEIAKAKKPYSIGEELLQPCLSKVVKIMLGTSAAAKIDTVPLSRRTITRRFSEMTSDVEEQLCSRLKESVHFALQFDESTDVANQAILVGFVRYAYELKIVEDIFCMCSLPSKTTAEEIFKAIDGKFNEYQLDWRNVVALCTDGAAAMTGVKKGVATRISDVANESFVSSHCIIHLEALASKKLSPVLNETLKLAVKIINNVKAKPLSSRIFALICSQMDSEHNTLLLHAEVRWLSRGKTLSRLFELRKELIAYFEEFIATNKKKPRNKKPKPKKCRTMPADLVSDDEESEDVVVEDDTRKQSLPEEILLEKLKDDEWVSTLAYLSDIFAYLNELNVSTQGRKMNCFNLWNKIEAFRKKLTIWQGQVEAKNLISFPLTYGLVAESESLVDYIQPIMNDHLQQLIGYFGTYFPDNIDPRKSYIWVVNPFLNVNEPNLLTPTERDQLIGNVITRMSMIQSIY